MKEIFPGLCGNENLKKRLASMLLGEKPSASHAYIIEGPEGSGKSTLALKLCAALACERRTDENLPLPCGCCPSCRKIARGICPDIILTGPGDKSSVGVESIRELRTDVHIYPNDLDIKAYIIEKADTMTVQAQNAFLLTLEEPPEYAYFFLLCESAASMLETVRSRAPSLRMSPLTPEQLRGLLPQLSESAAQASQLNPDRFNSVISASGGSAGKALSFLSSGSGDEIEEANKAAVKFASLCAERSRGAEAMNELLRSCGSTRETAISRLQVIATLLRDLVLLRQNDCDEQTAVPLLFFPDRESGTELAESFPMKRLLCLCDAVSAAADALSRGMNQRLTLMTLLSDAGVI